MTQLNEIKNVNELDASKKYLGIDQQTFDDMNPKPEIAFVLHHGPVRGSEGYADYFIPEEMVKNELPPPRQNSKNRARKLLQDVKQATA